MNRAIARIFKPSSIKSAEVRQIVKNLAEISERSQKIERAALQDVFATDNGIPRDDYCAAISKGGK
jgi:hypothetical protein